MLIRVSMLSRYSKGFDVVFDALPSFDVGPGDLLTMSLSSSIQGKIEVYSITSTEEQRGA